MPFDWKTTISTDAFLRNVHLIKTPVKKVNFISETLSDKNALSGRISKQKFCELWLDSKLDCRSFIRDYSAKHTPEGMEASEGGCQMPGRKPKIKVLWPRSINIEVSRLQGGSLSSTTINGLIGGGDKFMSLNRHWVGNVGVDSNSTQLGAGIVDMPAPKNGICSVTVEILPNWLTISALPQITDSLSRVVKPILWDERAAELEELIGPLDADEAAAPQVLSTREIVAQSEAAQAEAAQAKAVQTDVAQTNAPQADASQADAPQADALQTDTPQTDTPQTDTPQTDTPQADLPQDNLPQDNLPQDNLPQDNLSQDDLPQDDLPQDDLPQDDLPQDDLPQDNLPQDNLPQDNLPQDNLPQDNSPQDNSPQDIIQDAVFDYRPAPTHRPQYSSYSTSLSSSPYFVLNPSPVGNVTSYLSEVSLISPRALDSTLLAPLLTYIPLALIFDVLFKVVGLTLLILFVFTCVDKLTPSGKSNQTNSQVTITNTLAAESISSYETVAVSSIFASMLILSAVSSAVEDDILDSAMIGVLALIFSVLSLSFLSLGALLTYAISPISSGESLKRVVWNDVVNVALCSLRVILCWTRYIFYDLQVEGVDIALQQTDELFLSVMSINSTNASLSVISASLDIFFSLIQVVLSLCKLALASFLLWLVVDLFLLRPVVRAMSNWKSTKEGVIGAK